MSRVSGGDDNEKIRGSGIDDIPSTKQQHNKIKGEGEKLKKKCVIERK